MGRWLIPFVGTAISHWENTFLIYYNQTGNCALVLSINQVYFQFLEPFVGPDKGLIESESNEHMLCFFPLVMCSFEVF